MSPGYLPFCLGPLLVLLDNINRDDKGSMRMINGMGKTKPVGHCFSAVGSVEHLYGQVGVHSCNPVTVPYCAGVLNLIYDAMPSDFVTLIVTEFGLIPPTSVPVILREYRQEPAL